MCKRIVSLVLIAALLLAVPVSGSEVANSESDNASIETVLEEKVYSNATLEDEFADDRVLISLTNTASLQLKEYTPADFPEIPCSAVVDLTSGIWEIVKVKLTNGDTSQLGMDDLETAESVLDSLNLASYHRIIRLDLEESGKEKVLEAIQALELRDDVRCAEPDYTIYPCVTAPNDPRLGSQWAVGNIRLNTAWDITTGSSSVLVGVLDSGIDGTHPDLANRINLGYSRDFTSENHNNTLLTEVTDNIGHGTHVAGIIAAQGNNSIGISGVAWNATLVSLRVFRKNDKGKVILENSSVLVAAINYATVAKIPILNYSGCIDGNHTIVKDAITDYPGLFVGAAGNYSNSPYLNNDSNPLYPSSWDLANIIAVGAINSSNQKCDFSHYGKTTVDIFAPGESILSCYPFNLCNGDCAPLQNGTQYCVGKGYHYQDGTSMAAPFVTGVAALILSEYPSLTTAQVKERILNAAIPVDALTDLCVTGGRLDAYRALHDHSYTTYTGYNSSIHTASCACGVTTTYTHSYTYRYAEYSTTMHTAYCVCGASTRQGHSLSVRNVCTKCGYTSDSGLIPSPGIDSLKANKFTQTQ